MALFKSIGKFLFGEPSKQIEVRPPQYRSPEQASDLTVPLRQRAQKAISFFGRPPTEAIQSGFGLGTDFASQQLSPVAKRSKLAFRTETVPEISGQASG